MQPKYLEVFVLPSGRFKVMIWGSADGHIMDWRGCNYRFTPVSGQPLRGFTTEKEARAFLATIESDAGRKSAEFKRASQVQGTFLSDNGKYQMA